MREGLEVGRVLHEAEAPAERHERVPVEVAQGPPEGTPLASSTSVTEAFQSHPGQ